MSWVQDTAIKVLAGCILQGNVGFPDVVDKVVSLTSDRTLTGKQKRQIAEDLVYAGASGINKFLAELAVSLALTWAARKGLITYTNGSVVIPQ